jgi:hypothetical protein
VSPPPRPPERERPRPPRRRFLRCPPWSPPRESAAGSVRGDGGAGRVSPICGLRAGPGGGAVGRGMVLPSVRGVEDVRGTESPPPVSAPSGRLRFLPPREPRRRLRAASPWDSPAEGLVCARSAAGSPAEPFCSMKNPFDVALSRATAFPRRCHPQPVEAPGRTEYVPQCTPTLSGIGACARSARGRSLPRKQWCGTRHRT